MSASKFRVGETVEFVRGIGDTHIPPGVFTVVRVMPSDHQDRTYRVHGARDGQERVMSEEQMRTVPAAG